MGHKGEAAAAPARIRVLPEAVINQIAAGEVVERPASVVKELVENALDAGANQISVAVGEGGKGRITVLDNGCGMHPDDALLALQRHATSKIHDEAGLASIATLGFRGEALASIAAVSRFELVTCADEGGGGMRVAVEGGRVRESGRMGFPRGSRVTVEELFYNTPARRKFLRATQTEFQHLAGALVQLALAHPGVHFRLTHNGRPVHDLPRCASLFERAYQAFGRELAEGLVPVGAAGPPLGCEGLISHPSHARGSRRWQYLFLNGRPIRNAGLNHAVYQAYRTLLMKDRHPAYVLRLALPPEEVDVNVHPAKSEVRLRNPQLMHTVLADHLARALLEVPRREVFPVGAAGKEGAEGRADDGAGGGQRALPGLAFRPGGAGRSHPAYPEPGSAQVSDGAAPAASAGAVSGPVPPGGGFPPFPLAGAVIPAAEGCTAPEGGGRAAPPQRRGASGAVGAGAVVAPGAEGGAAALRPNPFGGEGFHFQPLSAPGRLGVEAAGALLEGGAAVLGQFHHTYLLVQRGDALLLVDQHAAHERILFEQYRTQFYEGRPVAERFLIPLTLELSAQNALLLEQYLAQWNKMGFDIEPFGRNSFQLRQIPALLTGKDVGSMILEVLDELALFGKSGRLEEVFNEILERVACHAAIRAGMALAREEMEALVAQLEGLDINLYCPHGRPVWVELPLRELEKRFKRIV